MTIIKVDIATNGYACGECHFLKRHYSVMFTETVECTAFGGYTTRLFSSGRDPQRSVECMNSELEDTP